MNNELDGIYSAVRARVSPDTQVVVTTYPRLVQVGGTTCGPVNDLFEDVERTWANALADTLDAVILAQAPKSDLLVSDVRSDFAGRGACSDNPAVNGVLLGRDRADFGKPLIESAGFHPNAAGIELYAQAVNRTLARARYSVAAAGGEPEVVELAETGDAQTLDASGETWFDSVVEDPEAVLAAYTPEVVDQVRNTSFVELQAAHKTAAAYSGSQCGEAAASEVVPLSAVGFSSDSEATVTVTVLGADGAEAAVLTETAMTDPSGVLRHEFALPEALDGARVFFEVAGTNDRGGLAYGDTVLEITTDASCINQAREAGALNPSAQSTTAVPTDTSRDAGPATSDPGRTTAATSPRSLDRTGTSTTPILLLSVALGLVGGALLAARKRDQKTK
jgi:hypothetical protein